MGMPQSWHRRQAITLASQLPDDTADALMVLQAARELVETFLMRAPGWAAEDRPPNVLPFTG
jgi:hypothetical protein